MFHAHEVHDRRVEVVHVYRVLHDVIAEVVGLAVNVTFLHAGTGHEHGEATRMVVAAVVGLGQGALRVDGAPEFATPDDEGVVEEPALLEVGEQASRCMVRVGTLALEGFR